MEVIMEKKLKEVIAEDFCFGDEDCKRKKRKSGKCPTGGVESGRNIRRLL